MRNTTNNITTFKRDRNNDTISAFKYLFKILLERLLLSDKNATEAYDSFLS